MRRVALIVALLGAVAVVVLARSALVADDDQLVIAHRGASAYAPENTVPSIELAIEQGADLVEVDVQLAADDEVILLHDQTLNRTTNVVDVIGETPPGAARPGAFTAHELASMDAGSWGRFEGSEYAGTHVPTLADALDVVRDHPDVALLIEIKHPRSSPGIERALAEQLQAARDSGDDHPHVVQSFDESSIEEFETIQQELGLAYDVAVLTGTGISTEEHVRYRSFVDHINASQRWLERDDIAALHELGYAVSAYVVNDTCRMTALVDAGVDGVITDRPDLARAVVDQQSDMTGC